MLGQVRVDLNDRERLENLREVMIRFLEDIRKCTQEAAQRQVERLERLQGDSRKLEKKDPARQAQKTGIIRNILGVIGFIFSGGDIRPKFGEYVGTDPERWKMHRDFVEMNETISRITGRAREMNLETVSAMDKAIPEIRSSDQALADLFNEICSQYDDETKTSALPFAHALIKLGYMSETIPVSTLSSFEAADLDLACTVTKIACDYLNGKTMTYCHGIATCPKYYNARRTHEIPFDVHLSILEEVWSKPWEEQRRIMDLRSKWFENSFPLREEKAEKDDA